MIDLSDFLMGFFVNNEMKIKRSVKSDETK